ncbi:hypothetical protein A2335_02825 [Candidatus Peregrinibacteria bacterium RIFOXYB2_FULL_32_7]|nr:MAG: hypothetical protein A2335_02825 [Candidatus Peregrinibacteria bacterium RIFOXYB2_FULL_32_7]
MSILNQIIAYKKIEVAERKKKFPLISFQKILSPSIKDFKLAIRCRDALFTRRSFSEGGQCVSTSIIAEIKKASPSEGVICKNFDHLEIAKIYEKYAQAISILTDEKFFQGSLNYLKDISKFSKLPLLRKDFIIDEYQIYESRLFGADAILLIANILTLQQIKKFIKIAKSLKMDCVVEIHDEKDLQKVLEAKVEIIGINNRNLKTFKIDLNTTINLSKKIRKIDKAKRITLITESGLCSKKDLQKLSLFVDSALIGTVFMKAKNLERKLINLLRPLPLIKICGITNLDDALFCEKIGVDLIGFNFFHGSKRYIKPEKALEISKKLKIIKTVGIFVNEKIEKVNEIAKKLNLDFIQLHGEEDLTYIKQCARPVIKAFRISKNFKKDLLKTFTDSQIAYFLFDGLKNGICFDQKILQTFTISKPFFIAGGINSMNLENILQTYKPDGIDLASGVEGIDPAQKSYMKIKSILRIAKKIKV